MFVIAARWARYEQQSYHPLKRLPSCRCSLFAKEKPAGYVDFSKVSKVMVETRRKWEMSVYGRYTTAWWGFLDCDNVCLLTLVTCPAWHLARTVCRGICSTGYSCSIQSIARLTIECYNSVGPSQAYRLQIRKSWTARIFLDASWKHFWLRFPTTSCVFIDTSPCFRLRFTTIDTQRATRSQSNREQNALIETVIGVCPTSILYAATVAKGQ